MAILNFECKATCENIASAEAKLQTLHPKYIGTDNQIDTYFNVTEGRLKLREGNIENALIWYKREDFAGAKQSDILLYKHFPDVTLKEILTKVHGIKVVVNKKRKIYFVENIKFHFDEVEGLGTFLEIEAIDAHGNIGLAKLQDQVNFYTNFFSIQQSDFIKESYSDMIIKLKVESSMFKVQKLIL
jgi:adenylate cyclase, class 2